MLPVGFVGSIQVDALARPAIGCMGYGGTGTALIAKIGDVAAVSISMTPQDICQVTGAAGTGGTGAGGTAERSGWRRGRHGRRERRGRLNRRQRRHHGRERQRRHRGRERQGRHHGRERQRRDWRRRRNGRRRRSRRRERRSRRHRRRGGTGGAAGIGGQLASRDAAAAAAWEVSRAAAPPLAASPRRCLRRRSPTAPSTARTIRPRRATPAPTQTTPGSTTSPCRPTGQYMATAGAHQASQPTPTDEANDRVRLWRLAGSVPTPCGSIDISNPGAGPAYVAFSPNSQYLAVAWRGDYVYVYSVPSFAMVGSILQLLLPALRRRLLARQPDRVQHRIRSQLRRRYALRGSPER